MCAFEWQLDVRVRCRGLVKLLELEERRLRLQPERRGELVNTYNNLLQVRGTGPRRKKLTARRMRILFGSITNRKDMTIVRSD